MRARIVTLPFMLLCLGCVFALAGNVYVDPAGICDGRTPCFTRIQAGIDAAVDSDTVVVGPGTYVENISFRGKAVSVISEKGSDLTIIDGNLAGSAVTFTSGEARSSVLLGFTVQNGDGSYYVGGGITIGNSSPSILGNTIRNNKGCSGLGIAVDSGSPLIQGNTITSNARVPGFCSGGVGGGGISVTGISSPEILENMVSNNSIFAGNGGGISLFGPGAAVIRNNVIKGNSSSGTSGPQGGGIWIVNQSDAVIVQNLISGNSSFQGGGIYWLVSTSGTRGPLLVNNTIVGNDGAQGSGLSIDGSDDRAFLLNNIIIAANGQPALACGHPASGEPTFGFNDVFSDGGPAYLGNCTDPTGGNGNISVDPSFVDPSNGDYHLQSGSPCVDTGDNNAPELPQTDLDGNDRIINLVVDMGVYEFFPANSLALPARWRSGQSPALKVSTGAPQGLGPIWVH